MVTGQLQAERRTGSVYRPKTGVLPTVLRNQPIDAMCDKISGIVHFRISVTLTLTNMNLNSNPTLTLTLTLRRVTEVQKWTSF